MESIDMPDTYTKHELITYQGGNAEDSQTLAEITALFGDRLEKLTTDQKKKVLSTLAILFDADSVGGTFPNDLFRLIRNLSDRGKLDLIVAVSEQLRA